MVLELHSHALTPYLTPDFNYLNYTLNYYCKCSALK